MRHTAVLTAKQAVADRLVSTAVQDKQFLQELPHDVSPRAQQGPVRVAACLLCLLFSVACALLFAPAEQGVTTEEYAIYSALVVDARSYLLGAARQPLVIRDRTGLGVHAGGMESVLARVQSSLAGVTPALLSDFRARNARSHALESKLQVSFLYFLISEQEEAQVTATQGGPDCRRLFEERYPNAQGIITLSRVGFSPGPPSPGSGHASQPPSPGSGDASQPDMALVYIGSSLCKDGAGYFVLMVRENGTWRVREKVLTWIA